jgi:hypothetical protein
MDIYSDKYKKYAYKCDKYSHKILQIGGYMCAICLGKHREIKDDDRRTNVFVRLKKCGHIFCMDCLSKFKNANQYANQYTNVEQEMSLNFWDTHIIKCPLRCENTDINKYDKFDVEFNNTTGDTYVSEIRMKEIQKINEEFIRKENELAERRKIMDEQIKIQLKKIEDEFIRKENELAERRGIKELYMPFTIGKLMYYLDETETLRDEFDMMESDRKQRVVNEINKKFDKKTSIHVNDLTVNKEIYHIILPLLLPFTKEILHAYLHNNKNKSSSHESHNNNNMTISHEEASNIADEFSRLTTDKQNYIVKHINDRYVVPGNIITSTRIYYIVKNLVFFIIAKMK